MPVDREHDALDLSIQSEGKQDNTTDRKTSDPGLGSVVSLPLWFASDLAAPVSSEAVSTPATPIMGDPLSSSQGGVNDVNESVTDC